MWPWATVKSWVFVTSSHVPAVYITGVPSWLSSFSPTLFLHFTWQHETSCRSSGSAIFRENILQHELENKDLILKHPYFFLGSFSLCQRESTLTPIQTESRNATKVWTCGNMATVCISINIHGAEPEERSSQVQARAIQHNHWSVWWNFRYIQSITIYQALRGKVRRCAIKLN